MVETAELGPIEEPQKRGELVFMSSADLPPLKGKKKGTRHFKKGHGTNAHFYTDSIKARPRPQ